MATEVPPDFRSPLRREPVAFEGVRVTPDDLPPMFALLEVFARDFRDEWLAFVDDLEATDARLAALPWTQVSPWHLITAADVGARVANGVRSFLPPEFGEVDPGDRVMLYFVRLILAGTRTGQPDPFIVARRASWYLEAGRLADLEIRRRARQHAGAWLLFRAALVARGIESRRAEQEAAEHLDLIPKAVWSRLSKGLRARIAQAETDGDRSAAALDPVIQRQALETAAEKAAQRDPFATLAEALGGRLSKFPEAVANDLTDAARKERVREGFTVKLRQRTVRAEGERGGGPLDKEQDLTRFADLLLEDLIAPSMWRPDEEARWERLVAQIQTNPKLRALVEAYEICGPDATQEEIGTRLGVTARTVYNLLSEVRRLADLPRPGKFRRP